MCSTVHASKIGKVLGVLSVDSQTPHPPQNQILRGLIHSHLGLESRISAASAIAQMIYGFV